MLGEGVAAEVKRHRKHYAIGRFHEQSLELCFDGRTLWSVALFAEALLRQSGHVEPTLNASEHGHQSLVVRLARCCCALLLHPRCACRKELPVIVFAVQQVVGSLNERRLELVCDVMILSSLLVLPTRHIPVAGAENRDAIDA